MSRQSFHPPATQSPDPIRARLQDVASSLAEDLRPVRRRLEKALAQSNGEDARQELRELLADLPQLFRRVNADPDTARAIEEAIVGALAEGMKTKDHHEGAKDTKEGLQAGDFPGHPFRGNQWTGGVPDMSEAEIQANIQRGRNAMWECLSEQKDITAAMMRPDIGDIDFVWDRNGRGIKHILERRIAELKAALINSR